jgi:hypothetical protein
MTLPEGRKPLADSWLLEKAQDLSKVTRVEIISDQQGRVFTNYSVSDVVIQLQDGARTLKVFISEKDNTNND